MDKFPIGQGFTTMSVDPAALVEVPETATYHDATKTVFRFYRAGTMVSRQEAEAMGMLPTFEPGILEEGDGTATMEPIDPDSPEATEFNPVIIDVPESEELIAVEAAAEPDAKAEPEPENKADAAPKTKKAG